MNSLGETIKNIMLLMSVFFIYSLTGIFSKLASQQVLFSMNFIFLYGISLAILVCYAFLWQIVLRKIPLMIAFSCKATVVLWGLFWGWLIFKEIITIYKIGGAALIILGILIMVRNDG